LHAASNLLTGLEKSYEDLIGHIAHVHSVRLMLAIRVGSFISLAHHLVDSTSFSDHWLFY
jgi:hypothetical protein